jgi:hypothetical protein
MGFVNLGEFACKHFINIPFYYFNLGLLNQTF